MLSTLRRVGIAHGKKKEKKKKKRSGKMKKHNDIRASHFDGFGKIKISSRHIHTAHAQPSKQIKNVYS